MNAVFSVLVRAAFTFVAFLLIQYLIPYYFLVGGGLLAGLFLWKTSDDKALTYGILIGSLVFGIFAGLFGTV
jgi:hypothetical protein